MSKSGTIAGAAHSAGAKRVTARPVDAATLILVDCAQGLPRVLMGQRRQDLAFMPGKYVFPGGRVDKIDKSIEPCTDLKAVDTHNLLHDMKGTPSEIRARAIALAAIRETYEEAGILIGERPEKSAKPSPAGVDAGAVSPVPLVRAPDNRAASDRQDAAPSSWSQFCAQGVTPGLNKLTFFARAITPPGRTRRFDTRFFCADASSAICLSTDRRDGELSALQWLTLEETADFDLPGITRVILEDLSERLAEGTLSRQDAPIPYYYFLNGSFRRELITASQD